MKRLPAVFAVFCLFVASACALAPLGASPEPSENSSPTPTVSPSSEPTPSAHPSAQPSVQPSVQPSEQPSPSAEPTTQAVVRIEWTGGFIPIQLTYSNYPSAVLYADGRLIEQGAQPTIYPAPALPTLAETQITQDGVATILDWARTAGLTGADNQLGQPVPDVGQTVFTVAYPDGSTHTTTLYPAMGDESPDPDMQAVLDFQSKLLDVNTSLPASDVGQSGAYQWDRLRVISSAAAQDQPAPTMGTVLDWPLGSLATSGSPMPNDSFRCVPVSGDDLATLMPVLQGANSATLWKSDGNLYQLIFHPLLPDDPDCPSS